MKRLLVTIAGALALMITGCASTAATAATAVPTASRPTAIPPTAKPTPKAPTPKPTAAPPIFSASGSGIKTTADFTVPSEWTLAYTYNCAAFGSTGNFLVEGYNSDGSLDFTGPSVNELGAKGSSSTAVHADSGKKYLSIDSECSWTVTVLP